MRNASHVYALDVSVLFSSILGAPAGVGQGEALLTAQRRLMDSADTLHPFYWSRFARIGDGERPLFSGS